MNLHGTRLTRLALVAAGVATVLAACAPLPDPGTPQDPGSDSDSGSVQGPMVTLPGTGRYEIGTEAPYGAYRLKGEPDSLPAGCTWSIIDEDGDVYIENQGSYASMSDVKEAVTFVTQGCPDWEQYQQYDD